MRGTRAQGHRRFIDVLPVGSRQTCCPRSRAAPSGHPAGDGPHPVSILRRIEGMDTTRLLRRSRRDRWIAGVVGGLAEYFGMSPGLLRIIYVLVSIFSAAFPGILVYIVLWIVMPQGD